MEQNAYYDTAKMLDTYMFETICSMRLVQFKLADLLQ